MKKSLIKIALGCIIIVLLARLGVFNALLMFILAGVIPGTTYSVPSLPMLLLTTGAIWLILLNTLPALKNIHKSITRRLERISS